MKRRDAASVLITPGSRLTCSLCQPIEIVKSDVHAAHPFEYSAANDSTKSKGKSVDNDHPSVEVNRSYNERSAS